MGKEAERGRKEKKEKGKVSKEIEKEAEYAPLPVLIIVFFLTYLQTQYPL